MGPRLIVPLGAVLAAAPLASQVVTLRVFDLRGAFDAVEALGPVRGEVATAPRFVRLCEGMLGQAQSRQVTARLLNQQQLLIRGSNEQIEAVSKALHCLRGEDLAEMRLQCTLVTLQRRSAAAAGLEPGKPKPATVAEAGALLKLALQQGGTLRNLPEVKALPLQPFVAAKPAAAGPKAGKGPPPLRVRGEGMQLGDDAVLLAVQLFAGDEPADLTVLPASPMLAATLVLQREQGALISRVQGEQATVLWLRLTGLQSATGRKPPPAPETGR